MPLDSLIARLAQIVGEQHLLTRTEDMAPHLREWRDLYRGAALAVVKPGATQEVAAIMRLATAEHLPVVPQGGNTGLVGGQIPDTSGTMLVLSLQRLDRVREVDPLTDTMTVEAGVTLQRAQEAAEEAGRLFPLSLASEGSCTVGGNIATNAGGTAVIAYGNTRDLVLGLEVVLADGRVWNGLGKLRKDNTGYDLKNLFVGSEGTLGIVTAAVLKLFPRPRSRATAFCGLASPAAALDLLTLAKRRAGGAVTTFELMPRIGLDFVLRHAPGTRDPLAAAHRWYVLIELSSQLDGGIDDSLEAILGEAIEVGSVEDAALASSLEQRAAFWKLREALSEVQRHEGGSIKHDVSVPVAEVPAFLAEATAAVEAWMAGCRVVAFGHLGDGNIHYNVSQPVGADKAAFLARWDELNSLVHGIVARYAGSISAEHGIGRLKRHLLPEVKDPVALALMRDLKRTLDPDGILNPGAVL
ncbi:FAD-binding oxidoreductase [Chelatococcus sp. SYSU_G07232]|uniref:FAD-binding oxidoreductase n=1 Tax=Chelatococcus albus TaxID=3047466 RepID=A0ABT7AEJ3_9HYPH|nr:FAD-binding oxidoreductase [Chelatococcus sp. SYSU_G07232]MDJ1157785.1 FAD-binding oxidoreductase [Chelatococcus sp. SYSU_G07232]